MSQKNLKKYRISGQVTISITTTVEASSAKVARDFAMARGLIGLCYQCASGDPTELWVTSGELDGEPKFLSMEEIK